MDEIEYKNLVIFHKRLKNNINKLNSFAEYLSTYISSARGFEGIPWKLAIFDELLESSKLIKIYNSLEISSLPVIDVLNIHNNILKLTIDSIVVKIKFALREIQDGSNYLDLYLKPNLSEKEHTKIKSLRKELDNFKKKNCDLRILQNLEEALGEGESGHHLACGVISARIVDHIIQFIKNEESLPNENINEEIIKKLRELKVVQKDEIAGQDKKEFLDAAKSSRDAVIHKIEFMPNGSKALSLLSYAFIITDLLIKYIEKKEEIK